MYDSLEFIIYLAVLKKNPVVNAILKLFILSNFELLFY